MEGQDEAIRTLTELFESANIQINDSFKNIRTLESLTKNLNCSGEPDGTTSKDHDSKRDLTLEEEEEYIILALEQERMNRIMELQKRDYIGEKLQEVITQNEDIMMSVKEYLITKQEIRSHEEEQAELRLNHYSKDLMEPKLAELDVNISDLQIGMRRVERLLNEVMRHAKDADTKLSADFQGQLNTLVGAINKVYNR